MWIRAGIDTFIFQFKKKKPELKRSNFYLDKPTTVSIVKMVDSERLL